MTHFDIFNGDADGIIALIQLRKHRPIESIQITGVKRDILLLQQCQAKANDQITVLDISMEKNKTDLLRLLESGAAIFYADHHYAGDIPSHPQFEAHIDLSANTCTSLIINTYLKGKFATWAIVGAYGDNMNSSAEQLADILSLTNDEKIFLKELGVLLNYNGYGAHLDQLHFHPATLFHQLMQYDSPFELKDDPQSPYHKLKRAYAKDMSQAKKIKPHFENHILRVFQLPNQDISKRIIGVFGHALANANPKQAHLVLTENQDQTYTVSLRAPLNHQQGADIICRQFTSGGGRAAAAGINAFHIDDLERLISLTFNYYHQKT